MIVSRSFFLFQSHSTAIMLTLAVFFKKIHNLFRKTDSMFSKNPNFCLFWDLIVWEFLLFQSYRTANMLLLALFKEINFFLKNPSIFHLKRTQVWNPQGVFQIEPYSTATLWTLAILTKFKFFGKNPNYQRFEIFYYSNRILSQVCHLGRFWKNLNLPRKTHLFLLKKN